MDRPQVRIVNTQEEVVNDNPMVSQSEMDNLLAKYGYSSNDVCLNNDHIEQAPVNNLTFEEMLRMEEAKEMRQNKPKPNTVTIDPNDVRYHSTSYGSIDDTGFGIQITISSDMDINGNRYR